MFQTWVWRGEKVRRTLWKLSPRRVATARPKRGDDRATLSDGGNLYLEVSERDAAARQGQDPQGQAPQRPALCRVAAAHGRAARPRQRQRASRGIRDPDRGQDRRGYRRQMG